MTVAKLRKILAKYPDDMLVLTPGQDEYDYEPVWVQKPKRVVKGHEVCDIYCEFDDRWRERGLHPVEALVLDFYGDMVNGQRET